jgi:hypothetical protein
MYAACPLDGAASDVTLPQNLSVSVSVYNVVAMSFDFFRAANTTDGRMRIA